MYYPNTLRFGWRNDTVDQNSFPLRRYKKSKLEKTKNLRVLRGCVSEYKRSATKWFYQICLERNVLHAVKRRFVSTEETL